MHVCTRGCTVFQIWNQLERLHSHLLHSWRIPFRCGTYSVGSKLATYLNYTGYFTKSCLVCLIIIFYCTVVAWHCFVVNNRICPIKSYSSCVHFENHTQSQLMWTVWSTGVIWISCNLLLATTLVSINVFVKCIIKEINVPPVLWIGQLFGYQEEPLVCKIMSWSSSPQTFT